MKYLFSILLFISAAFIIASCQKELSFEEGAARGTLKEDATGDCLPSMVSGTFKTDTLLNATNFVDVQLDISQSGTYSIKTDTLNGYSFSATGVVAVEGLNTIRLVGSGRPVAAALDVFTVKFDTSSCEINITVTGAGGSGGGTAAVYTLVGSPTTCTGATQTNNFYATIPTNASNYVDVKANVTTAGTYTISTPVVNGVSFSASGALAVGTNQNIRLLANGGTPTAAGTTFNYALTTTTPASNCGFNLTVQAAPSPATFTFNCGSPTFFGTYQQGVSTAGDSVRIQVTSTAGGSYNLTSTTANNVTFTGSGVLAASPNPQNVILFASAGPANASGSFTYTITGTGGTGTCSITQTYSAAPTMALDTINFTVGSTVFRFNQNTLADYVTDPSIPNYTFLAITGDSSSTSTNPTFGLAIGNSTGTITPGTYTVNQGPATIVGANYTDNTGNDFSAFTDIFSPIPQMPPFTINVTSINAVRVRGTFFGPLEDSSGVIKTVVNGFFSVAF